MNMRIRLIYIISFLFFVLNSCGELLLFSDFPGPDTGNIKKIKLFLSLDNIQKLSESRYTDEYSHCLYEDSDKQRLHAFIKIRGGISISYRKKSYTLKFVKGNDKKLFALDASYKDFSHSRNRLLMFAYRVIGLPAPKTKAIALFINDTYMGYYTQLEMYDESMLSDHCHFYCQLFKCKAYDMNNDFPPLNGIEKKFPDDNDFSPFFLLIHNAKTMNDTEWIQWVQEYIDIENTAKYLAVHDFLAVGDTASKNYYILYNKKYMILPWDNEDSMRRRWNGNLIDSSYYQLGGDNILTRRLLQYGSPVNVKYNEILKNYFLDNASPVYLTDTLISKVNEYYEEIDKAVKNEPLSYKGYEGFLEDKQIILDFLSERKDEIDDE